MRGWWIRRCRYRARMRRAPPLRNARRCSPCRRSIPATGGIACAFRCRMSPREWCRAPLSSVIDAAHIRLASAGGVEAGTILEVFNPAGGATVGDLLKVTEVNRGANFTITLDGAGISVAQSAPGLAVRSREFRLSVYLFRQPDPALPSRNETILDSEVFRYLSMDPRHSRYVQDVIGDINGALRISDRRPEGESRYIRVSDLNPSTDIRLGPETLVDRPAGRPPAAGAPCARRSGPRQRFHRHAHRRRLHRPGQSGSRGPHRAPQPAQHRGDQHRRLPGPHDARRCRTR